MLKRFLPREENFFKYFQEIAEQFFQAAKQLQGMTNELAHAKQYAETISQIEQQSDKVTHATFELLHKTFITPFDRHDIHQLTSCLDDTLDRINLTARYITAYQFTDVPVTIHSLIDTTTRCAEYIQGAILQLKSLANSTEIIRLCDAISMAEDDAQNMILTGIADLFTHETDIKRLLKLKDIYGYLGEIMMRCQHIANIIRGIVLEYA